MDAAEVVETGRKLSETTLGEWGMILSGAVFMAVPLLGVIIWMWCRNGTCKARLAEAEKYRAQIEDCKAEAEKYRAQLKYCEKVLEEHGIGRRDDTDVGVFG
jgi:hypothetical protein